MANFIPVMQNNFAYANHAISQWQWCCHLIALSLEDLRKPISKTSLKIEDLEWFTDPPVSNELICYQVAI